MDQEVEVGCCVDENNVGGGSKHWRQRAGKSKERGLKSKGVDFRSICCLRKYQRKLLVGRARDSRRLTLRLAMN